MLLNNYCRSDGTILPFLIGCPDGFTEKPTACYKAIAGTFDQAGAEAACQLEDVDAHLPVFRNATDYSYFTDSA